MRKRVRPVFYGFRGAGAPPEDALRGVPGVRNAFILISIKNVFYPLALSNAHDGITRKVVDCLAETVYHLFQCSKYLIAKSSGS